MSLRSKSSFNFIDFDQLTSISNSIKFEPSESISIKQISQSSRMYDQDDDVDGSDLLNMINRSLQDFNDSMRPKQLVSHNDSAYNTASSSLSKQDAINSLLADEMLHKMNLQLSTIMHGQLKNERAHQQFRNDGGDISTGWYGSVQPCTALNHSVTSPSAISSRRRLQSCSTIESNGFNHQEFKQLRLLSPNSFIEHSFRDQNQQTESQPKEVLCHPKYCSESPTKKGRIRSSTNVNINETNREKIDQIRNVKRVSAFSCSLDNQGSFVNSINCNQGHQIAKANRACSFYLRGHCKKEDCEFAHDLSKVTCRFWKTNCCIKGDSCPFLHGYPPGISESTQLSSSLPCPDKSCFMMLGGINSPPSFR